MIIGKEEFGEVTIRSFGGKPEKYPCYTCGHCSQVVVMRAERTRPRKRCMKCFRIICEQTDICADHCTPLNEMARDHFENAGEAGKYVPAIMKAVQSKAEAHKRGLITL
jgi:hypothetical protein